jgi:hypothetical protein
MDAHLTKNPASKHFTKFTIVSQQIANSRTRSLQSLSFNTQETRMPRLLRMSIPGVLAVLFFGILASAAQSAPHNNVLIKNAIVMTVTHGNIQGGSIYVKDGKIAAVGKI